MASTIIQYYGAQEKCRCGYCKGIRTSNSHGMHAYVATPEDYQDLLDRGWRRSGSYCYKPNMKTTCCPSYTLRCDVHEFKLSKSQKKILKRMNKFLTDGIKLKEPLNTVEGEKDTGDTHNIPSEEPDIPQLAKRQINPMEINHESDILHSAKETIEQEVPVAGGAFESCETPEKKPKPTKGFNADLSKGPCKKAKELRIERKRNKLAEKGLPFETAASQNEQKIKEKSLADYINNVGATNPRHKLKAELISSNRGVTDTVIALYRKYQVTVHNDPPQKITKSSFERFLVRTPLKLKMVKIDSDEAIASVNVSFKLYEKYQTHVHNDPPEGVLEYQQFLQISPLKHTKVAGGPPSGYGSFHLQYWLDERLIAVEVIDILPNCISSVYFFYDPEFSFLSLGTYGSLRQIDFIQRLAKDVPQLKYYYMGFYIHSCQKMRYKGNLMGSYLLCPEVYTWHALTDEIRRKLDEKKYQRLNDDPNAKDENEFRDCIGTVAILVGNSVHSYGYYQRMTDDDSADEVIKMYGKLIGKSLCTRLVYIFGSAE